MPMIYSLMKAILKQGIAMLFFCLASFCFIPSSVFKSIFVKNDSGRLGSASSWIASNPENTEKALKFFHQI
jgi:hypothetical protein